MAHAARGKVQDTDRGWATMLESVRAAQGKSFCKVGILGDDQRGGLHTKGPDGKASPLTVAEIAVVQEFGTEDGHIPARSFVRSTYDRMRAELSDDAGKLIVQTLDGKMTVERALNLLGLKLASGIKTTITESIGIRDDAESTKRIKEARGAWNKRGKAQAKGWGVRPLIDTGAMLAALTWAVVLDGAEQTHSYLTGK